MFVECGSLFFRLNAIVQIMLKSKIAVTRVCDFSPPH